VSAPQRFVDQHGQQQRTMRCSRCRKVCRDTAGWNMDLKAGAVAGFLCPTCQSPEENAEAEINLATLEYRRDSLGRLVGRAK
jgi:MinD superfamily P-loop ATPase